MEFDEKIQDYLDSVYVRSHSDESVKSYKNALKKFSEFTISKYQLGLEEIVSKISTKERDVFSILRDFVVFQDKSGLSPRTIHLSINGAKGFLRYLGIRIYNEDFKQFVKMPRKIKVQEIPITKEIIHRLLRNVSPKLHTVILVAISTGMRIGELVQITIKDIDFNSEPVKIKLRAEITKTRTSREVFLTKEATLALKDYLRRYHNWNENDSNSMDSKKQIFGRTSIGHKTRDSSLLKLSPLIASKTLLQKTLENAIKKIPDLNAKNENGIRVIHFHGFRKFFRTVVGNTCGRDFAEALMGHSFYLDTYYLLDEKKKKQMFLDAEPYLTISDFEAVKNKMQSLSIEQEKLKKIIEGLRADLIANKITVPTELLSI